jgi:hypothetical protein
MVSRSVPGKYYVARTSRSHALQKVERKVPAQRRHNGSVKMPGSVKEKCRERLTRSKVGVVRVGPLCATRGPADVVILMQRLRDNY